MKIDLLMKAYFTRIFIAIKRLFDNSEVANFLQKLNIYVTIILTTVATYLAFLSYDLSKNIQDQATKIEGMQEMLSSFNPVIGISNEVGDGLLEYPNDKFLINFSIKNYGIRPARIESLYTFVIMDSLVHWEQANVGLLTLGFQGFETISVSLPKAFDGTGYHQFLHHNVGHVVKIVFSDPITNVKDSVYYYNRMEVVAPDSKHVQFVRSSPKESEFLRNMILPKQPSF